MNKTELAQRINDTAAALQSATAAKAQAALSVNAAKAALAEAETTQVLAGVEGKNETERKAKLAEATAPQVQALKDAETAKITADMGYDVAKINWDAARQLVSIYTSPAE